MMKTLLVAAAFGLTISSAGACEFARSAKKVDQTTTASTTQQMTLPDAALTDEQAATKPPVVEKEG